MQKDIKHRYNGAIGALLDEYENSINDLIFTIKDISIDQLTIQIDKDTDDNDCKSIQSILTHVVQSGCNYIIEIRKWLNEDVYTKEKVVLSSIVEYTYALKNMFRFSEQLFEDHPNLNISEHHPNKKITVPWGQKYDVEQLIEHAIVHILRHRRQVELFKLKMNTKNQYS